MTAENKLQTSVWLNDLYAHFLINAAAERKTDTATLHRLANEGAIKNPQDAVANKLIDAVILSVRKGSVALLNLPA